MTSGPDGLSDDWATAAVVWDDGLVVGTYSSGLAVVREDGVEIPDDELWVNAGELVAQPGGLGLHDGNATRIMTTVDGLVDNDVTDIVSDERRSLLATRGGLSRLRATLPAHRQGHRR